MTEHKLTHLLVCFPYGSVVKKNPPANAGDTGDAGLILGLGGSPGKGNGNPLQYSCLENSMLLLAWRSLASYSPLGSKELDVTERLSTHIEQG